MSYNNREQMDLLQSIADDASTPIKTDAPPDDLPYRRHTSSTTGISYWEADPIIEDAPADNLPYQRHVDPTTGGEWVVNDSIDSSIYYNWSADTSNSDPGAGYMKGNNSNISLITEIYINKLSLDNKDVSCVLAPGATLDGLRLIGQTVPESRVYLTLTGRSVDAGTYYVLPVKLCNLTGSFNQDTKITTSLLPLSPRVEAVRMETIVRGVSPLPSQTPTGLGIAGAIYLSFGDAQGGPNEPYELAADGTLTVNQAGTFRIRVGLNFARVGNPGTAVLLFRGLINGVQTTNTISANVTQEDAPIYLESSDWANLPAGAVIKIEVMRDLSGIDSGGVYSLNPTDEGEGTWDSSSCAFIELVKLTVCPDFPESCA